MEVLGRRRPRSLRVERLRAVHRSDRGISHLTCPSRRYPMHRPFLHPYPRDGSLPPYVPPFSPPFSMPLSPSLISAQRDGNDAPMRVAERGGASPARRRRLGASRPQGLNKDAPFCSPRCTRCPGRCVGLWELSEYAESEAVRRPRRRAGFLGRMSIFLEETRTRWGRTLSFFARLGLCSQLLRLES